MGGTSHGACERVGGSPGRHLSRGSCELEGGSSGSY